MALGIEDVYGGYYIVINIGDNIYSQDDFISFFMKFGMNEKPTGELLMIDRSGLGFDFNESGKEILIEFNNVSDGSEYESSSLTCVIDSIEEMENTGDNVSYKLKLSAGNSASLNKKTFAYTGSSPDALEAVYSSFNVSSMNDMKLIPLNQSIKFSDTMTWRCVGEDMWEQMNDIVKHSYKENDYLFWTWDDVNNSITISTLENAKSNPSQYILIHDVDHIGDSDVVKRVKENPNYTIWNFGDFRRLGTLGANRDSLYPNMSFIVTDGINQNVANIRNQCFAETIKSMGDTSIQEISESTDLGSGISYGEIEIVRHNPNNTHSMYSVAPVIRNYIRSKFSKKMRVVIYNNAGPSIGSNVTVICEPRYYRTGSTSETIDYKYSDSYIVTGKTITYTSIGVDNLGRPTPSTARQRTIIELESDNFAGDGREHITKIVEDLRL